MACIRALSDGGGSGSGGYEYKTDVSKKSNYAASLSLTSGKKYIVIIVTCWVNKNYPGMWSTISSITGATDLQTVISPTTHYGYGSNTPYEFSAYSFTATSNTVTISRGNNYGSGDLSDNTVDYLIFEQ